MKNYENKCFQNKTCIFEILYVKIIHNYIKIKNNLGESSHV